MLPLVLAAMCDAAEDIILIWLQQKANEAAGREWQPSGWAGWLLGGWAVKAESGESKPAS